MDRLTVFLYLLMRDELPTGTVASLVERAQMVDPVVSAGELAALAERYATHLRGALVEDDEEGDDEEGDEGFRIQRVENQDGFVMLEENIETPPEMQKWLDLFDDRISGSSHFVRAVNEAAAAGMFADEVSARLVGQRVAELQESDLDVPVKGDETEEIEKGADHAGD